MTCPLCAGTAWTRVRFMPAGEPPATMILSRCDGCGLHGFRPPTDVPDFRPEPAPPAAGPLAHLHARLEECADPVAALRDAAAGLAPGGAILVTVADSASLGARLLGGAWAGWEPGRQRWVFDATTLRAAIERAGLAAAYVRRAVLHGLLIARAEPR